MVTPAHVGPTPYPRRHARSRADGRLARMPNLKRDQSGLETSALSVAPAPGDALQGMHS
jgi:hypothetical protein